jgi:GT2 family glycosyltransferase
LNSYHDDIELIIVDSPREGRYASTDIKVQDPRVIVMRLAKRESISHARNLGYMASSGEYIFFLDSDNILGRETIPQLVAILKDSSIGVVGPITYYSSNPKIVWSAGTYKSRFFRLHKPYSFAHGYPFLYGADIIPNAFMTKRKVLDDVGLFDSHNFTIQEEESDWQWTCRERGLRTVICSSAAVFHDIPISGYSHFSLETIQESFKSRFWIERKHKVGNILGFALSSIALSLYYVLRFRHGTGSRLRSSNSVLVAIARGVMAGMFGKMRVAPEKAIQIG